MLSRLFSVVATSCVAILTLSLSSTALADPPVVLTVPGDANNPTIRHPVIAGQSVTLKGALTEPVPDGETWDWSWDPQDGTAPYTGTVTSADTYWAIWVEHTYAGDAGDFKEALLTVTNAADESTTTAFDMIVRANTVPNRANAAINEALWYSHRNQVRILGDEVAVQNLETSTIPMGFWTYPDYTGDLTVSIQGATLNAFEANGHRENGDASNPYTETVSRGMKYLFARLGVEQLAVQTFGPLDENPRSDDPDTNGNGIGISLDSRTLEIPVR
jgi:hypothetical protein